MSENIAIGIALYHPDDCFIHRLEVISSFGFKVYLYNNGVDQCLYSQLLLNNNYTILGDGINCGLGKAINELNFTSFKDGHDFLIFFDQDTIVNEKFKNSLSNINIASLMGDKYSVLQIISEDEDRFTESVTVSDVLFNINSGSIFNLSILKVIGFHDSSFFVEGVDYEFCLRSRTKGFSIGILTGVFGIDHFSNQEGECWKFLGKEYTLRVYPKSRVKDLNTSHSRLILQAIKFRDFKSLFKLFRFTLIFNTNNFISKVIIYLRKAK